MSTILEKLALCIEKGEIVVSSPYPNDLIGKKRADELTKKALVNGIDPNDILNIALIIGMTRIGVKFKANEVFIPELLLAASDAYCNESFHFRTWLKRINEKD